MNSCAANSRTAPTAGPNACARPWTPAGSPRNCGTSSCAPRNAASTPPPSTCSAPNATATTGARPPGSWSVTPAVSTSRPFPLSTTPSSFVWPPTCCPTPRCANVNATPTRSCSSTSTRTPTPPRNRCCAPWPATGATSWRSATRTSPSMGSAAPRYAASSSSRSVSRPRAERTPTSWPCAPAAAAGSACSRPRVRSPDACPRWPAVPRARSTSTATWFRERTPRTGPSSSCRPTMPRRRPPSSPTPCGEHTSWTGSHGRAWP